MVTLLFDFLCQCDHIYTHERGFDFPWTYALVTVGQCIPYNESSIFTLRTYTSTTLKLLVMLSRPLKSMRFSNLFSGRSLVELRFMIAKQVDDLLLI